MRTEFPQIMESEPLPSFHFALIEQESPLGILQDFSIPDPEPLDTRKPLYYLRLSGQDGNAPCKTPKSIESQSLLKTETPTQP